MFQQFGATQELAGTAVLPLIPRQTALLSCMPVSSTRLTSGDAPGTNRVEHTDTKANVPTGRGPGLAVPVAPKLLTSITIVFEANALIAVGGRVPPVTVNVLPGGPEMAALAPLPSAVAILTLGEIVPSVPELATVQAAPVNRALAQTHACITVEPAALRTGYGLAHWADEAVAQLLQVRSSQNGPL